MLSISRMDSDVRIMLGLTEYFHLVYTCQVGGSIACACFGSIDTPRGSQLLLFSRHEKDVLPTSQERPRTREDNELSL